VLKNLPFILREPQIPQKTVKKLNQSPSTKLRANG
jgi:hypothetical protein